MSTSTIVFQTHVKMVDDVTMESILMNASVQMGGKERIARLTLMSVWAIHASMEHALTHKGLMTVAVTKEFVAKIVIVKIPVNR